MRGAKALLTSTLMLAILAIAGTSDAGPKKPKKPKDPKPVATEEIPFDKAAASTALSAIDLQKCKTTNAARGEGHVMVKFTSVGTAAEAVVDKGPWLNTPVAKCIRQATAAEAVVDKGPWLNTPVAKCIAKEFKKATVPAFSGDAIQVGKSFRFD